MSQHRYFDFNSIGTFTLSILCSFYLNRQFSDSVIFLFPTVSDATHSICSQSERIIQLDPFQFSAWKDVNIARMFLSKLIVYFGNLVASYLLSFCISLAFEAPVVNLLKIAFTSKKRAR